MQEGINTNPVIFNKRDYDELKHLRLIEELDLKIDDAIDSFEVFDIVRNIQDPEHPLTLEDLNVITLEDIAVDEQKKEILVGFTPTVPNCSSAALIGLIILAKLQRALPSSYHIKVFINKNCHDSEIQINKQMADKERVAAAFENANLINTINAKLKDSNEKVNFGDLFN